MYHAGEVAVQRKAGVRAGNWGSAHVTAEIPDVAADFLAQQRLVAIGAADADGLVWASALVGPPGFVSAPDERTVVTDRAPRGGDPLAGRFDTEQELGMVAIEPATRRRMRVNGTARRVGDGLLIRTGQVYANCPKYLQTRLPEGSFAESTPGAARDGDVLTATQREWIAGADTFFVTTLADGKGVDTSHRGGNPGFVAVTGERTLTWPDYTGNSMYMTLGNLELDARCGLLFLDWEHGHALHLSGRARTDWDPGRAAAFPGAHRLVDFALERAVEIGHAFPMRWSFEKYSKFNPS
ncbi:pyridoxamine 5'-phosphate oxidase family protein [Glycomyces sp. NPDC048151]|uniref:pyridoxamine 5'-phosphate oxidase family protein n=1 Tax=Glycomyces sp. NPDC048151 TaxID=3364002 RepID=UPI0037184096